MTTPDAQARTLGDAIERQQRQREVARESAREIKRDRDAAQATVTEGEQE